MSIKEKPHRKYYVALGEAVLLGGPATRNRTWIYSLEGYCSIRWTIARNLERDGGIEPPTLDWKSKVIPFYESRIKNIYSSSSGGEANGDVEGFFFDQEE